MAKDKGTTKKPSARVRKSAAVRRAIQVLERQGRIRPKDVVDAARDPTSPLHAHFDWQDSVAGEKWRLEQARELIRWVVVRVRVTKDRMIGVPVYVRDPRCSPRLQGYVTLSSIRGRKETARSALGIELQRVEGQLVRAESIAEVCGLLSELRAIRASVSALRRVV